MTEKQAKVTFCPLLLLKDSGIGLCIVSACMMWRWKRDDYADGYQPQEGHEDYDEGYCGLGGKP
jgi:hypothetical protein